MQTIRGAVVGLSMRNDGFGEITLQTVDGQETFDNVSREIMQKVKFGAQLKILAEPTIYELIEKNGEVQE